MFNLYNWIEEENVAQKIVEFIELKDPDILCLQEFHTSKKATLKFSYKYEKITNATNHSGQVIYSKFKIINSGSLNFSNSTNNAIFIDILKNKDTLRIYNVHLESLRINPKEEELTQENSEKIRIRLENGFKIQANQASLILQHQEKIKYKSIICGDFNNTAFSWVYKKLKTDKNDAFEEAGSGFGKTYEFPFPLRIDFILSDKKIEINNFKTYTIKLSDHYPIMARLNF
jgi:endonuclease/exonuclease/phosphatase family metal-dependent hydrolase